MKKSIKQPSRIDVSQLYFNAINNFTQTSLASNSDKYSHDSINRYFCKEKFTGKDLLQLTKEKITLSKDSSLSIDDTVCEKWNTKQINLVKKQYSGNYGGIVPGIGIITTSYNNSAIKESFCIDYDVFDFKTDGLKKTDHVYNQIMNCINNKDLLFNNILFDSYYSSAKILNAINNNGKFYYTKLRRNRIIYIKRENKLEKYQLKDLILTEEEIKYGVVIRLNKLHANHFVKLFCLGEKNLATEHIITNDVTQKDPLVVQKAYKERWNSEQLYKDSKQLNGLGQCEARKSIIQRNHIFFSLFVTNCMRKISYEKGITANTVKNSIYADSIKNEFKNPRFIIS